MKGHTAKSVLLGLLVVGLSSPIRGAPPHFPATFDRETVTSLVATADNGGNSQVLKIGYFVRRSPQNLSIDDGIRILEDAIEKEKPGSHRWFVLQDIRAFGLTYGHPEDVSPGLVAYEALFDQVINSGSAGAEEIVQGTVSDYVTSVTVVTKRMKSAAQMDGVQSTFVKAISAYFRLPKHVGPDVPWKRAIRVLGINADTTGAVERGIQDPASTGNTCALAAAAEIFLPVDPKRSLSLLDRTSTAETAKDPHLAEEIFDTRVEALRATGQTANAITLLQASAKNSGRGWAKLLTLSLQVGDGELFKNTVAALKQPDANEDEIIQSGAELIKLSRGRTPGGQDRKADLGAAPGDVAVDILRTYVSKPRARDVAHELNARLFLSQYLFSQGQYNDALLAAHTEATPPFPNRFSKNSYEALLALTKTIQDKQAATRK